MIATKMDAPYIGGININLLYDFQYTIPGGKKDPVFLKKGEQYRLIEKKTDRWLAVSKLDQNDVFYVPTSYTEEIYTLPHPIPDAIRNPNKAIPPPLPVKPKNLFEKMTKELKIEPPTPPTIDEDAHIELFKILSGNLNKIPLTEHKLTSHGELFDGGKPFEDSNKNQLSQNVYTEDSCEDNEIEENIDEKLSSEGYIAAQTSINGYEVYIDEATGNHYYYNPRTKVSSWTIPKQNHKESSNYVNLDWDSSVKKLYSSSDNIHYEKQEDTSDTTPVDADDAHYERQTFTKSGQINKLKLSENGRKLKKNWTQSFIVLEGGSLYFFKDQKSTSNKSKSELTIDLPSSFVVRGGMSNKQNLIQVITSSGTEYLLQFDDQDLINDWFQSLTEASALETSKLRDTTITNSKSDDNNITFKPKKAGANILPESYLGSYQDLSKPPTSPSIISLSTITSGSTSTLEKSKFKEKLKLWLLKRPTKEALREKGIYKDAIFGSTLSSICEKEGSDVPLFVIHCIEAVEQRGLLVDGIYRVNGNMAEIQKLRFAVNTNGSESFISPPPFPSSSPLDIHVITGALKLFFRELQEPLFPYEQFDNIMTDFNSKKRAQTVKSNLSKLPRNNYQTLNVLLQHLLLVVSHADENRMHIHNLSIVFGPTLMWPKESCDHNLAVSMVMRCQLVEMLLQDYSYYFDSTV